MIYQLPPNYDNGRIVQNDTTIYSNQWLKIIELSVRTLILTREKKVDYVVMKLCGTCT